MKGVVVDSYRNLLKLHFCVINKKPGAGPGFILSALVYAICALFRRKRCIQCRARAHYFLNIVAVSMVVTT